MNDTDKIAHHLKYEWEMLQSTYKHLDRGVSDDTVRNALVESLYVHGRVLIDFFTRPQGNNSKKPDDINVEDLGGTKSKEPEVAKKWRKETDKRVAHMTKVRFERLSDLVDTLKAAESLIDWCKDRIEELQDIKSAANWQGPAGPQGPTPK